jgi:mannose-6-phosphate isomerase
LLSEFGLNDPRSPLQASVQAFALPGGASTLEALFRSFFTLGAEEREQALTLVLGRAREVAASALGDEDLRWVAKWLRCLAASHGADPGLFAVLLLRPLRLEPGQAVFLPARRLHAYLSGVGLEVMAESDNVLRGGLTSKHVDVQELCNVLDFEPSEPYLIAPEPLADGRVLAYRTPAEEFELWRIDVVDDQPVALPSPSVFVVLSGEIEVTQGSHRMTFARGAQGFASWSVEPLFVRGGGQLGLATARATPQPDQP